MKITIDKSGMKQLEKNFAELAATTEVRLVDKMPPAFVSAHSSFADLDALFKGSGFKIDTLDDFAAIPDAEWDAFIRSSTDFESWEEMQVVANREYVTAKLNKGMKKR